MADLTPWRTGIALSVTVVVAYVVCAILFYAWPGAAMEFLNSLFHGLEFRKLEPAAPWSLTAFVSTIVVLAIWGFLVGTLFAWLHNRLGGSAVNG
jgi:hypothetical protein